MMWPFNRKTSHSWTDWAVMDRGTTTWGHYRAPVGWYLTQERSCTVCGKVEVEDKAFYGGHDAMFCYRRSELRTKNPRADRVPA